MQGSDGAAPASLYDREVRAAAGREYEREPCEICDETRVRERFTVAGVAAPIVECAGCGLARYDPMPDADEIASFYPAAYYGDPGSKFRGVVERVVRAVAARHIAFLSRELATGASVLDVGCGRGVLFQPLADRGFRVFGVEANEHAIRGCDPRAEVRIATRLPEARFDAESMDEIVIWHVLEHVRDPFETIRECRRLLKPGGRLIVAVPNFESWQARWSGPHWFHLDPPRHLYHFPASALARLVERHGFRIRSTHHFSLRQNPFGWVQSALNRFGRRPAGTLYTMLHRDAVSSPLPTTARMGLWLAFLALAPIAVGLSVLAALMRTGGTVHVVAIRE